jgi:hypothetical protein
LKVVSDHLEPLATLIQWQGGDPAEHHESDDVLVGPVELLGLERYLLFGQVAIHDHVGFRWHQFEYISGEVTSHTFEDHSRVGLINGRFDISPERFGITVECQVSTIISLKISNLITLTDDVNCLNTVLLSQSDHHF